MWLRASEGSRSASWFDRARGLFPLSEVVRELGAGAVGGEDADDVV